MDISNDPDAWCKAEIEGKMTSLGTGHEEGGLYYGNNLFNVYRTYEPVFNPNGTEKRFNIFWLEFRLDKPKDYVGKVPGLLSFQSPYFDKDTVKNMRAFIENLLRPGLYQIDDGVDEGNGWDVILSIRDKIETPDQRNIGGTTFRSRSARKHVDQNYFEIIRSERIDRESFYRYVFWFRFQAELYSRNSLVNQGVYFGKVEKGEAKLYIDIEK